MSPHTVRVAAGGGARNYDVLVGRGLLGELPELIALRAPAHRYVVISDSTVASLHARAVAEALSAPGGDALLLDFPAGEAQKTRATWADLTDQMLAAGCGRDTAVVAVGGGVTGDLAGFVAATFLRGVSVVQVPTSLVAMIDSAVGGKTGVDTPIGKNLVGAFHPPLFVAVDPETTRTLPRAGRAQGLVEALKHGAIRDGDYFDALARETTALLDGDPAATERAVLRSIEIKSEVVSRDERESGLREILNFGHTVGHAVEAASEYVLPHGTSVAIGMVAEARLGERLGVTESGTADRISAGVEALGLSSRIPAELDVEAALARLGADKKRREGRVRCVLLRALGDVAGGPSWSHAVEVQDLRSVLD